jgi:hypothetical protein
VGLFILPPPQPTMPDRCSNSEMQLARSHHELIKEEALPNGNDHSTKPCCACPETYLPT